MCAHVSGVTRLANTSATEFEQRAYSAEPVIVTDATADWKAVQVDSPLSPSTKTLPSSLTSHPNTSGNRSGFLRNPETQILPALG